MQWIIFMNIDRMPNNASLPYINHFSCTTIAIRHFEWQNGIKYQFAEHQQNNQKLLNNTASISLFRFGCNSRSAHVLKSTAYTQSAQSEYSLPQMHTSKNGNKTFVSIMIDTSAQLQSSLCDVCIKKIDGKKTT